MDKESTTYEVEINDLALMCNMLELASNKGAFGLEQASKIWECVKNVRNKVEKK